MTQKRKTNFSKQINNFSKDILATIQINNKSKQDFYNDVLDLKLKRIPEKVFIDRYKQLFDGTFRKFGSTKSFLGSYRRNINPKFFTKSKDNSIVEFNRELREQTDIPKGITFNIHNLVSNHHKPYAFHEIKGKPKNFSKKFVLVFQFTQKQLGNKFFRQNKQNVVINNFDYQISNLILTDLALLNQQLKQHFSGKIVAFSTSFTFEFEMFRSKPFSYNIESLGQRSAICIDLPSLQSEQLDKLQIISERFKEICTSKEYFIFQSNIYYNFYVPLKQKYSF